MHPTATSVEASTISCRSDRSARYAIQCRFRFLPSTVRFAGTRSVTTCSGDPASSEDRRDRYANRPATVLRCTRSGRGRCPGAANRRSPDGGMSSAGNPACSARYRPTATAPLDGECRGRSWRWARPVEMGVPPPLLACGLPLRGATLVVAGGGVVHSRPPLSPHARQISGQGARVIHRGGDVAALAQKVTATAAATTTNAKPRSPATDSA